MVTIFIVCGINLWPFNASKDFASESSLLGAGMLNKIVNPDRYIHSGYHIESDACRSFSLSVVEGLVKMW